jgi:RNA polymerase sigma-70 factor (ECF subfamily)
MSEEHLISIFTHMRKRLRRLAMQFLPDEEDADDALQEAFCRLWPRADALANAEQAEAATTLTVRNLCIDEVRRRDRRPTLELEPERDGEREQAAPSPQEEMERKEQFALVEALFHQRLTPLQQQIFRMKEYEEKSYEEIATLLGMEQTAVRMNLSRARKLLREEYRKRESYTPNQQRL